MSWGCRARISESGAYRDNVVSDLDVGDSLADGLDDTSTLQLKR